MKGHSAFVEVGSSVLTEWRVCTDVALVPLNAPYTTQFQRLFLTVADNNAIQ